MVSKLDWQCAALFADTADLDNILDKKGQMRNTDTAICDGGPCPCRLGDRAYNPVNKVNGLMGPFGRTKNLYRK